MAWSIWLKSSSLPVFDHCWLDGHLLYIIWQLEGMAADQGERQAEVHYKVQMAWHLNMLPSGTPSLKDVNSDKYWTCSHQTAGLKKGRATHSALNNTHGIFFKVDYTVYTVVVGKRTGGWLISSPVIAPCHPN